MPNCDFCGTSISSGASKCGGCGAPYSPHKPMQPNPADIKQAQIQQRAAGQFDAQKKGPSSKAGCIVALLVLLGMCLITGVIGKVMEKKKGDARQESRQAMAPEEDFSSETPPPTTNKPSAPRLTREQMQAQLQSSAGASDQAMRERKAIQKLIGEYERVMAEAMAKPKIKHLEADRDPDYSASIVDPEYAEVVLAGLPGKLAAIGSEGVPDEVVSAYGKHVLATQQLAQEFSGNAAWKNGLTLTLSGGSAYNEGILVDNRLSDETEEHHKARLAVRKNIRSSFNGLMGAVRSHGASVAGDPDACFQMFKFRP